MKPKVTVLMTVFNGERYLKECIDSVLNQTFKDFEFLIIDDCSADSSADIVRSYGDKRIRLIENHRNLSQVRSLNIGLEEASSRYIARIDQDDLMMENRLERQLYFLDKRPDIAVVGTWGKAIEENGRVLEAIRLPIRNEEIIGSVLFCGYFLMHPSVMFRKDSVISAGKYSEDFSYAEDYNLWTRILLDRKKIANIPEFLIKFRYHKKSSSRQFSKLQLENVYRSMRNFIKSIGGVFSEHDLDGLCNMLINIGLINGECCKKEENIVSLKKNISLSEILLEKTIRYFNFKITEAYFMKKVFLNRMLNFTYEVRRVNKKAGNELYMYCLRNYLFILERPKLYSYFMA